MRSTRIFRLLVVAFALAAVAMPQLRAEDRNPWNVLMIPVDDLSDYVSVLQNHPGISTPNIDRLAERGVSFSRAYAAAPLCQPSRAAVVSGMAPHRTGIYQLNHSLSRSPVALAGVSLAEQFKQHGYDTFMTGKYYHGKPKNWWPAERIDSMWTEKKPPFSDHGPYLKKAEVIKTSGIYAVGPAPEGMKSMPDVQSLEHTRRWLSEKRDRPFFLVQGINKPHLSFTVPQEFFDLYPLESIQLPKTVANDLDDVPAAACEIFSRKDSIQFKAIRDYQNERGWKLTMQGYLASISFSDWVLGEILDALEAGPYAANTIIVFWSDHGYHIGEKEKLHKQTLWSQACRVPLIISHPDSRSAGTHCDAAVSLLDLFPTLNELCELEQTVPQKLDGHSLVPLLDDPSAKWNDPAITSHGPENVAVSDSRYRLIRYTDGSEELYDHTTDPREFTNLAGKAELATVKKHLAGNFPIQWAQPADRKEKD